MLGRNAKTITADLGHAIHIIMDRASGKTHDCYVEFFSSADAASTVKKLMKEKEEKGRHLKLADRHVEIELSSQQALMKDLFPRANNVQWTEREVIVTPSRDPYCSGFKSFVTGEELVMLVKLAEQPQRES